MCSAHTKYDRSYPQLEKQKKTKHYGILNGFIEFKPMNRKYEARMNV